MFNKNKIEVLTSEEIRKRFLKFFEKRDHAVLESASLIPENDTSVLFNTAGMQPLVPYLLGQEHPRGKRLVDIQKCVRTNDIEEVGDKTHLTFFEMMGNWSLGDYFKEDSLKWSYEFLTSKEEGLGLDPQRIYVTIFAGNDEVAKDMEAFRIWKNLIGIDRIFVTEKDNWWEIGENGPAGVDSEIFYDLTEKGLGNISQDRFFEADEKQEVVEIWNNVFMEYEKRNGKIIGKLKNKNIDTGAGLERMVTVLQKKESPFETDLFDRVIKKLENNSGQKYDSEFKKDFRVIADHLRTSIFLISEGVVPSNKDQGYVLRRLLRRSLVRMNNIQLKLNSLTEIVDLFIDKYKNIYNSLESNKDLIKNEIQKEINKFDKTLERGLKEFYLMINPQVKNNNIKVLEFGMCEAGGCALNELSGSDILKLFTTYGLPLEIIKEEAKKNNIVLDEKDFKDRLKEHQKMSTTAAVGKFKGGLGGDSEKIKASHTATHLLLAGLRRFLGSDVFQKGSNITEERIRFDFSYGEKVPRETLDEIEEFVNKVIDGGARVGMREMNKEEARSDENITGSFWEKYPDIVKIYSITDGENIYSQELCGGPHVENTKKIGDFGRFKIVKESSSSAGVRRIKAILDK